MRSIRFREALAAYLHGQIVAHLRLLSVWSITAGRLHFWMTEERGEVPMPALSTYRTDETALQLYAESLAEENDRLRMAIRYGARWAIDHVLCEVWERIARFFHLVMNLLRVTAFWCLIFCATFVAIGIIRWTADALTHDLPAYLTERRVVDPPDVGVPHERYEPRFAACLNEPPRYILRWTYWQRTPQLIRIVGGAEEKDIVFPPQSGPDVVLVLARD